MNEAEYLQLLAGFEQQQLRRHSDPWGNLTGDPLTHELRRAWERTAAALKEDYPEAVIPTPFWFRPAIGEEPAAGTVPSDPS